MMCTDCVLKLINWLGLRSRLSDEVKKFFEIKKMREMINFFMGFFFKCLEKM